MHASFSVLGLPTTATFATLCEAYEHAAAALKQRGATRTVVWDEVAFIERADPLNFWNGAAESQFVFAAPVPIESDVAGDVAWVVGAQGGARVRIRSTTA